MTQESVSEAGQYSRLLFSLFSPFPSTWLLQPDAGALEPDVTVDDDPYYTGGAYYYVLPADDDLE